GLAEAITEQTGWVFRARAPEHLVAQLLEFRDQREAAGEKSRNGRRLVETEFDAAKLARQRAALFEAVLPVRS
ncbi:MAG: colanic acid biosynthesis glycosyltransferase WcaL, partial [Planctomycetes bacterium]|nr:colanic acid biosynthesis glycosyltransferase WcaL [Planctomycetota bacterium]